MTKYKEVHPAVRRILSMRDEVEYHLTRENRTVEEEYHLILKKESKLPARLREFILEYFDKIDTNEESETQGENITNVHPDVPAELHPGE
jgi:hypothetical protein